MVEHTDNSAFSQLLERVIKHIAHKLPEKEVLLVKKFIKQYFLGVALEELSYKSVLDLYGSVLSHWHFIYKRQPGETKIKVYNPQIEQHGWQSNHTVIEIIQDDTPFLIDSIRMALSKRDINIHMMIHMGGIRFVRDSSGVIQEILEFNARSLPGAVAEAPIFIEIDRQSNQEILDELVENIKLVSADVTLVVQDWSAIKEKVSSSLDLLVKTPLLIEKQEITESMEFIDWLLKDHFTFLGYAEYTFDVDHNKGQSAFNYVPHSGLGLLNNENNPCVVRELDKMSVAARKLYKDKNLLMIGKTNTVSTVHRDTYTDFIGIKLFDQQGELIGERIIVGLYTSLVYHGNPKLIPLIRGKIQKICELAQFPVKSHDHKALLNILETLPRDDLFHSTEQELYQFAIGTLHIHERQKIKLLLRRDVYGRYFSCLVFVPREKFNSELRENIQDILLESLSGTLATFATRFSESSLARIHIIVRVEPLQEISYSIEQIEEKLAEAARTWQDDLKDALFEYCGEEQANELFKHYGRAFPFGYKEMFTARTAVVDIEYIEKLREFDEKQLEMSLYRPIEDAEDSFRFKLFRNNKPIPLSDVVPMLENMGLRIISERPYQVRCKGNGCVWINDYRMISPQGKPFSTELVKDIFQEAFAAIWYRLAENDKFNRLVLSAGLTWREVSILRAYYKYLWQAGMGFSQNYVEDALFKNSELAKKIVILFKSRFNPKSTQSQTSQREQVKVIEQVLDKVKSLNEDRIIRYYLDIIHATTRTNYFQLDIKAKQKKYMSFKFDSLKVPGIPLPKPLFEIFVYSPDIEGIHLRGSKVARGGLRWSDRIEDFRTEVLGLMKAQQVKNAVIVPLGAKGGFVVKNRLEDLNHNQRIELAVKCYKIFIRGLLDITDNRCYLDHSIIKPVNTVCYDEDDPYLVVAADKGTATFSDLANEISKKYNFWLGDAFASGGATGYDHKKMGITARGVWESVKIHFQRLKHDVQTMPFTVVGIGDMNGDVFGNGMLLSRQIKLVAAYNHKHIFIDPNPDCEESYKERERLFNTHGSGGWDSYNKNIISEGGGVFLRSGKSIKLTAKVQELLSIKKEHMIPNELIRAILMMEVDLLWNGGVGTFVKASSETDSDVGDRGNDSIRINGSQLNCKVVGEGGNLGLTQLARVEYAQKAGIINTDAIDNSAGVNCSDNEVNIKILLDEVVENGDLTGKQRNQLLVEMSEEVAEIVLNNNRRQNEAISIAESQAAGNLEMHHHLIKYLERCASLNREIEFLPSKDEISSRKALGLGLTRPEIAILAAYVKIYLKNELLESSLPEESFFRRDLENSFPTPIKKRFKDYMYSHKLKKEIIVTQVSNTVVDEMGINFIHRLADETGATASNIVIAYMVSRDVFEMYNIKTAINALIKKVSVPVLLSMRKELNRLIRRGTRWFLRNRRGGIDIESTIIYFTPKIDEVRRSLSSILKGVALEFFETESATLIKKGVPIDLAYKISGMSAMFSALDIVEAATDNQLNVTEVAKIYFSVGSRLELSWFREQIKAQSISNHWEALARAAFRDDVDRQQRNLAIAILQSDRIIDEDIDKHVELWLNSHQSLIDRWDYFVTELKSITPEFTMFAVALRELLDLSHAIYYSKDN